MKTLKTALLLISLSLTGFTFSQTNTISSTGNVGIGTLTPSATLDVNGQMIVDSLVIIKDSLHVQQKLKVDQDMKVNGLSTFTDNSKFKADIKVLGVAKMKSNIVIDGLTKMNGDAKIFGDLKIKSMEDLNLIEDRFLMIKPNGKAVGLDKSGLLASIYSPQSLCLSDANGNVLSSWAQVSNPSYGILYTGFGPANCNTRVGIGTNAPQARLDVRGTGYFSQNVQVGEAHTGLYVGNAGGLDLNRGTSFIGFNMKRAGSNNGIWSTGNDGSSNGGATIYGDIYGSIRFSTIPSTGGTDQVSITDNTVKKNTRLFIHKDGNIGVGTEDVTGYKLSVEGFVRARKVVVNADTWADYVFTDDYSLAPLSQVEEFIEKNKHLPDVPSEKEVTEKGVDLGTMDAVLLKKIEELTLYIIEQEKRIQELENK